MRAFDVQIFGSCALAWLTWVMRVGLANTRKMSGLPPSREKERPSVNMKRPSSLHTSQRHGQGDAPAIPAHLPRRWRPACSHGCPFVEMVDPQNKFC